jgi:hypothetical protein
LIVKRILCKEIVSREVFEVMCLLVTVYVDILGKAKPQPSLLKPDCGYRRC